MILGHVLICTPFCIAILTSAFQSLDRSLEEAAYDLGETPFSTFRLIILPLVMPGIISSLLISFTISLDEFIIAFFLAGTQADAAGLHLLRSSAFPRRFPSSWRSARSLSACRSCFCRIAEYFRRRGIARSGAKDTGGFL